MAVFLYSSSSEHHPAIDSVMHNIFLQILYEQNIVHTKEAKGAEQKMSVVAQQTSPNLNFAESILGSYITNPFKHSTI